MVNQVKAAPEAAAASPTVKNCTSCNKPMKKAKRYYRNGKYYCNRNCWKASLTKVEKKE